MELLNLIKKDMIIASLEADTKVEVIYELVERYCSVNGRDEASMEKIVTACLDREALGSTSMENGIAIPHAKLDCVNEVSLVIGLSPKGIAFGDEGEICNVFFLLLANKNNPSEHIKVLSSVAKLCSSSMFVRFLNSAKTEDEILELFFD